MRNILVLFLFIFSVSAIGQSSTYEKYNDLTGRYEYFDTNTNTLIAYKTYNSLQQRWETVYVNNGQDSSNKYNETKSSVNTELLSRAMGAKQQRYDYNVQRIKDAVSSINRSIDNTYLGGLNRTPTETDYNFVQAIKSKFDKDYVQPLYTKRYDYSNDSKTNEIIDYLNNGFKYMIQSIINDFNNYRAESKVLSQNVQTVKTTIEVIPRTQSVISYAPIFKNPSLLDSDKIGTAKDNKVEVLEKYNDKIYKVKSGNVTGYIAIIWFNN